jgi:hypothetical protein
MIDAGDISARIDESAGMVELYSAEAEEEADLLPELHERLDKIQMLQRRMQAAIKESQLEPRYAQLLVRRDGPALDHPTDEAMAMV